ncbi:MAG: hybrid sensor histidine kinase/response regulator [Cyanobacteria bacterium P01_D01_bin.115]
MTRDIDHSYKGDILVVDDRADNLRLLATMLSEQGYKVRKILKGELTLEVAQINPPDLILLDVRMPKINGFEVCQQLKADHHTESIPIIFLSASDEHLDKVKAFRVGGEDFITKPFEITEVLARIGHQLKLVRLKRQLRAQNQQLQAEVAERLKAEAALQQANDDLEARVSQRTLELTQANQYQQQLGQQLQQSLAQEQKLSQLKSQIITTIAHEYRTPMSIISSSIGMLEDYGDRLTGQLRNKHFGRVQKAMQRMTDLIDEVIFLNQLEFETLEIQRETVSFQELIDSVSIQIKASSELCPAFQVEIDPACDHQMIDRRLMTKILLNVLHNAAKFSPAPSPITVQVFCTSEQLCIIVEDTGMGIPEQELARVFESFYRAQNAENIQGIGLGLTIALKCTHLLNGQIDIESQLDLGTRVKVSLPMQAMAGVGNAS